MPVQTLSEALDNLYTTTWENRKAEAVDQIFDGTPFWFALKEMGGLESVSGGRFLSEPLRYAKSDRVQFIGRGGTVNLSENEFLTEAVDDWKYLVDSIVRFGVDDQKNRGKFRIISLMNSKLDQSNDSLIHKVEEILFDQTDLSTAQQALAFNDLLTLVDDTPATGTVHGINAATYSWWQNQATDMTGLSWAIHGHDKMRTMFNNCGKNLRGEFPNLIVSGQTPYEYYEASVIEQKRIVNKKMADAGFENIQFKGKPMVWSPSCANTRLYFLNLKYIKFKFDPTMNFDMTKWKDIPDQVNDRAAQIITAGNLMTSRRRCHGVLHTIDTA